MREFDAKVAYAYGQPTSQVSAGLLRFGSEDGVAAAYVRDYRM